MFDLLFISDAKALMWRHCDAVSRFDTNPLNDTCVHFMKKINKVI